MDNARGPSLAFSAGRGSTVSGQSKDFEGGTRWKKTMVGVALLLGFAFQLAGASGLGGANRTGLGRTVVIFSASYGGGHDSSAAAIRAELLKAYPDLNVVILYGQNYLPLGDRFPQIGEVSGSMFNMLYQRSPKLYDWVYAATMKTALNKRSASEIPNPFFSSRRVQADLERLEPDAIISTWHIMTSKLIGLREKGADSIPKSRSRGWTPTSRTSRFTTCILWAWIRRSWPTRR